MSDGSNERYPSVALKNGAISIFTKIKGIEVVRNTNELQNGLKAITVSKSLLMPGGVRLLLQGVRGQRHLEPGNPPVS